MGDALSLVFRWVGPTREVVTVSLDLIVAHASEDLSLSAPSQVERPHLTMATPTVVLATLTISIAALTMAIAALTMAMLTMGIPTKAELPLHVFELSARFGLLPALGGAPRAAAPLTFWLHPVADDDDDAAGFSNLPLSQLPASLAQNHGTARVPCVASTASDGRARSACGLSLPGPGRYRALVCAATLEEVLYRLEGPLCTSILLGRTAAAWAAAPLESYLENAVDPEAELLTAPTAGGAAGTLSLKLVNPLTTPLSALLLWGNRLQRRTQRLGPLPPGATALEIPVGDECAGSRHPLLLCLPWLYYIPWLYLLWLYLLWLHLP